MQAPSCPIDEAHRLDALQSLGLLDSQPDPQFDRLVRIGRNLFDVEICLISLVDEKRQWFKARAGLDATETSRDISFCGHAILNDEIFVVPDATQDERFHDNPLVVGPPHIRFYAGAPLRLPTGYTIGTFCVISGTAKTGFGAAERAQLRDLADVVIDSIALNEMREMHDKLRELYEKSIVLTHSATSPLAAISSDGLVESCNESFSRLCGVSEARGMAVDSLLNLESGWRTALMRERERRVASRLDASRSAFLYVGQSGFFVAA